MNTIKLKLDPYKNINIVSLDGKPISPYSELNNYMKEPFLQWVDKLLDAVERELNDDFELIVSGEKFECWFLADMSRDYDCCIEYSTEPYQVDTDIDQRFNKITELAEKYGVNVDSGRYRLPAFIAFNGQVQDAMLAFTEREEAFLIVADRSDVINKNYKKSNHPQIIVVISDKSKVTCLSEMCYVWEITPERLNDVVSCIIERFVKVRLITDIAQLLRHETLSDEDLEAVKIATAVDVFILVEDLPNIEVGNAHKIVLKSIPAAAEIPTIRIVSGNNNIIAVDGLQIIAKNVGQTFLEFYKSNEIVPFSKKQVSAFQDNTVKNILLSVEDSKMGIGRKQLINARVVPEDAEDAGSIKWSVDNPGIVEIDQDGSVTALRDGVVTITASTQNASEKIEIDILPNLSNISISLSNVNLYVGETQKITVSTAPVNAFDKSYNWKTSDKEVAIIDHLDDGTEIIRATGIGECQIICAANEGDCSASCSVSVESTFKKKETSHGFLGLTAVFAIAAVICTLIGIKILTFFMAAATIIFAIVSVRKNKKDWFWAILLIAVSIVSLFIKI